MILLVEAVNWPFSLHGRILRMHSTKSSITLSGQLITNALRVNQLSSDRVMLYIHMKVSSGGCAAVTLCSFSFARDGRDATNGSFDAAHSLDCCADCSELFLTPTGHQDHPLARGHRHRQDLPSDRLAASQPSQGSHRGQRRGRGRGRQHGARRHRLALSQFRSSFISDPAAPPPDPDEKTG